MRRGGKAQIADASELPFSDKTFDVICAFDVVEHIENDTTLFREISRVLKPGGHFCFSVPLHKDAWSSFDNIVGHCRRYDFPEVLQLLSENNLCLESSSGFGMKPKSRFWTDFGMWWLEKFPERAFYFYNKYLFPLGLKRQEPLKLMSETPDPESCEGAIFLCKKQS